MKCKLVNFSLINYKSKEIIYSYIKYLNNNNLNTGNLNIKYKG